MPNDHEPVWLKPDQVDRMRNACYSDSFRGTTQARNDALIATMADTGLRVGEVVALRTEHLNDDNTRLVLPPDLQKTYQQNTPGIVRMELGKLLSDLPRTMNTYLNNRWKESPYIFPSQMADDMSTQSVRNMVKKVAVEADVNPYGPDNTQREPESIHPHAFRHSIAFRMLEYEDGYSIDDVKMRLRHKRRETTEDTYSHFLTV